MKNFLRVTVAALAAGAVLAAASPATAAPKTSAQGATSKSEQQQVAAYWTPERMKNASSADSLAPSAKSDPTASKSATKTMASKGKKRTVPAAQPKKGLPGGKAIATIGKVFFVLDGNDYSCSGNVVSSPQGDIVVTAGHCVNEGGGAYATSWAFAPGYANGNAPLGLWTARALITTTGWAADGDINVDAGFAVMNPRGGKDIAEVTGSTAIGFNLPTGLRYKAFGYPAGSPYDGETLKNCGSRASKDKIGGTTSQAITCTMTGGSSGGPWFTPSGVQNSVNSFGYGSVSARMYGPYFGTAIEAAYNQAVRA